MSSKPQSNDYATRQAYLVKANQIITHSKLVYEDNLATQQQLREAESRIDQLLTQIRPNSQPPADKPTVEQINKLVTPLSEPPLVWQLRQQMAQRSKLFRQSAHDLKSSFSIIRWVSDILHEGLVATDEQRELLDMLHRHVQQATQLVTELLDLTRLEAGQEQRRVTHFNVAQRLGEVVETLQPFVRERGLWLRSQGPELLIIDGDWVKLHRIVQNLLLNAITYTKQGGVTLEWHDHASASGQWQVSVTDTGPGLSAARHEASGEGVGLLIVQELCALLEGQLNIEQPLAGGTRFTVSLPYRYST